MNAKLHIKKILFCLRNILNSFYPLEEHSILVFHSISSHEIKDLNSISPERFRNILRAIKKTDYQFVSLEDTVSWFNQKKSLPKKTVSITFDDGYKDFLTNAIPILKEFECPATVFVVEGEHKGYGELMTGNEIQNLKNFKDISVGFHTRNHLDLRELDQKRIEEECVSRDRVYNFFAFPGGNYSDKSVDFISKKYHAAFSIKPELVTKRSDQFLLPRIVVTNDMDNEALLMMISSVSTWYRKIRRVFLYVTRKN